MDKEKIIEMFIKKLDFIEANFSQDFMKIVSKDIPYTCNTGFEDIEILGEKMTINLFFQIKKTIITTSNSSI